MVISCLGVRKEDGRATTRASQIRTRAPTRGQRARCLDDDAAAAVEGEGA